MGSDSWSTFQKWDKSVKVTLVAAQASALEEQGYETVEEAHEATDADGTASVIDIEGFGEEPAPGQCWELTPEECEEHFGTRKPSRQVVEEKIDEVIGDLSRGESLCVVAWTKDKPEGVVFAGWSYD